MIASMDFDGILDFQDLDIIVQDGQTYGPDVIQDPRDRVDVWN